MFEFVLVVFSSEGDFPAVFKDFNVVNRVPYCRVFVVYDNGSQARAYSWRCLSPCQWQPEKSIVLYNLYISGHVVSGGDVMYKQILIDGFRY